MLSPGGAESSITRTNCLRFVYSYFHQVRASGLCIAIYINGCRNYVTKIFQCIFSVCEGLVIKKLIFSNNVAKSLSVDPFMVKAIAGNNISIENLRICN